jgi:hypothetical protein
MKKPEWTARGNAAAWKKDFENWTIEQLEQLDKAEQEWVEGRSPAPWTREHDDRWRKEQNLKPRVAPELSPLEKVLRQTRLIRATHHADCGKPEMLRQMYPEIAKYIFAPPLARGKRYRRLPTERERKLSRAVEDVWHIRGIWQRAYDRKNRSGDISAEEIAAKRWGVTKEEVLNQLKKAKSRFR